MTETTEIVKLRDESGSIIKQAITLKVEDRESYSRACELLKAIKRLRKQVHDAFAETIKRAHEAHKAAKAAEARYDEPLEAAEQVLKRSTGGWLAAEDARQREAERVQAETVQKAMETGDLSLLDNVAAPVAMPKSEGVSARKRWVFEITDESLLPREFLMANEAAIRERVNRLGPAANIPGVVVRQVSVVAVRT